MSQKLIKKMKEDGFLYSAVDIPDGEWSKDEINKRVEAQAEQFTEQYQTTSMGPGDKAPIPGDRLKPTPAVVVKY